MELTSNSILRERARQALSGNWEMAVLTCFVFVALVGVMTPSLIGLLFVLPLEYGFLIYFLGIIRGKKNDVSSLFSVFNSFGRVLGVTLLVFLYTFLWTLLFVIPGIIKQYSYAMTYYIMEDEPDIMAEVAIDKSMA